MGEDIRATLDRYWAASEAGDDDAEDEIYHDDAVLEYPQSGERIRSLEFRDGKVFREAEPWSGRAQWVERID